MRIRHWDRALVAHLSRAREELHAILARAEKDREADVGDGAPDTLPTGVSPERFGAGGGHRG